MTAASYLLVFDCAPIALSTVVILLAYPVVRFDKNQMFERFLHFLRGVAIRQNLLDIVSPAS